MNKKIALLIVDVQVAMFSYQDEALYNGENVLNNILSLLNKARLTKTPVIFIQHTSTEDDVFSKGKNTWDIHPKIKPIINEKVIEKTTCDSFFKTTLHEELQKRGIEKLVIVGMQTEYCIDTTCRRALSMGYEIILVQDAHSTFDGNILKALQIIEHHNDVLGGGFVELKHSDEIEFL
ncbi:MAG: cysteine hydrolase family protein [Clostridium sp.]|uniref:cysteine hydrolase family protein n=1 Tax=Clostridium sp. TaxID=1506 RepID=UPI003D6D6EA2